MASELNCFKVFLIISSHLSSILFDGLPYAGGLLYDEWCDYFPETPRSNIAWIVSLNTGLALLTGPIATIIYHKIGYHKCYILGVIITTGGILGASFTKTYIQLIILYGLIAGVGNGIAFLSAMVAVNVWFDKLRMLANSIAYCGVSIGIFLGSFIFKQLLERYGWPGTLMIFSGLTLQGLVLSKFIQDPPVDENSKSKTPSSDKVEASIATNASGPYKRLATDLNVYIFLLSSYLFSTNHHVFLPITSANAKQNGYSELEASHLVTLIGGFSAVGRISSGFFTFQKRPVALLLLVASSAISGAASLLVPLLSSSYTALAANCAVYGFSSGIQIAVLSPSVIEVVSIELFTYAIGFVSMIAGIAGASAGSLAGPIATIIYHKIGYHKSYILGVIITTGGILGASFTKTYIQLIILYGLIAGVGNGIAFLSAMVAVNVWFDKLRMLANSIAYCGVSIGIFLGSFIFKQLLELYGWPGTLMIFSGLTLQGLVLSEFIQDPPVDENSKSKTPSSDKAKASIATNASGPYKRLATDLNVYIFLLSSYLFSTNHHVFLPMTSANAKQNGYSDLEASHLVTLIGGFSAVGRISSGLFTFQKRQVALLLLVASCATSGAASLLVPSLSSSYTALAANCAVYGFSSGIQIAVLSPSVIEVVSIELFPYAIGFVSMIAGIAGASAGSLAGFIFDQTGSYSYAFYTGGSACLLASVLYTIIKIRLCKSNKTLKNTASDPDCQIYTFKFEDDI